jgi:hypothetical protein
MDRYGAQGPLNDRRSVSPSARDRVFLGALNAASRFAGEPAHHVVFTLPHALVPLALQNPQVL